MDEKNPDFTHSHLNFLYKTMVQRDPNKRRIKLVNHHDLLDINLNDSSEDSDFIPGEESSEEDLRDDSSSSSDEQQVDHEDKSTNESSRKLKSIDSNQVQFNLEKLVCMVCLGDNKSPVEYMVECDLCGLVVHESCYGIPSSGNFNSVHNPHSSTVFSKQTLIKENTFVTILSSDEEEEEKQKEDMNKNQEIITPLTSTSLKTNHCVALIDHAAYTSPLPQDKNKTLDDQNENSSSSSSSKYSTEPWFCSPCRAGIKYPICKLCPFIPGVGAFKETDVQSWVHLICALYTPRVAFADVEKLNAITLFELNYKLFGQKECAYCEDSLLARTGICIKCDAGLCKTYFHVTCAQKEGLLIENYNQIKTALPQPSTLNEKSKRNQFKPTEFHDQSAGAPQENTLLPESAYFAFCKLHNGEKEDIQRKKADFAMARSRQCEYSLRARLEKRRKDDRKKAGLPCIAEDPYIYFNEAYQTTYPDYSIETDKIDRLFYKTDLNETDISRYIDKIKRKEIDSPSIEEKSDLKSEKRLLRNLASSRFKYLKEERPSFGALLDNWVPSSDMVESYSKPLTSDPLFLRALMKRANVYGVSLTKKALPAFGPFIDCTARDDELSNSLATLSKYDAGNVAEFSPTFISYFLDRERHIQKLKTDIASKTLAIHRLKAQKNLLQSEVRQVKDNILKSHNNVAKEYGSLKNICEHLSVLKGKTIKDIFTNQISEDNNYTIDKINKSVKINSVLPADDSLKFRAQRISTPTLNQISPIIFSNHKFKKEEDLDVLNDAKCHVCLQANDSPIKMIRCDTCQRFYHLECHDPPLKRKPSFSRFYAWQCSDCVEDINQSLEITLTDEEVNSASADNSNPIIESIEENQISSECQNNETDAKPNVKKLKALNSRKLKSRIKRKPQRFSHSFSSGDDGYSLNNSHTHSSKDKKPKKAKNTLVNQFLHPYPLNSNKIINDSKKIAKMNVPNKLPLNKSIVINETINERTFEDDHNFITSRPVRIKHEPELL